MPTRLLLEGPDIQELLARVRAEHGPKARIVQADKIRTGGFAGFFTKERYEVAVEIPDAEPPAAPAPAAPTPAAANLLDMIDEVRDHVGLTGAPAAPYPVPQAPVAPAPAAPVPPASVPPVVAPAAAAPVAVAPAAAPVAAPPVAAAAAPAPAAAAPAAPAPAAAPTVDAGTYTVAAAAQAAPAAPAAAPAPQAAAPQAVPVAPDVQPAQFPQVSTSTPSFANVLAGLAGLAREAEGGEARFTAGFAPAPEPTILAAPQAAPASPTAVPQTVPVAVALEEPVALQPQSAAAPEPVVEPEFVDEEPTAAGTVIDLTAAEQTLLPAVAEPQDAGLTPALQALGVPAELTAVVAATPTWNSHAAVARLVAALPDAPKAPAKAGDVLVIVGDGAAAYGVARKTASAMRLDPDKVLLAAPTGLGTGVHSRRRIPSAAEAVRRSRRLHLSETATIVAVDAPLGRAGADWARGVISGLEATAVWAVVDATRKTGDVAKHLRRIGGVDAVAVENLDDTADPCSVLALGVPVAALDGRRATPAAWSALLGARLGTDEEDE
ncbi:hypothetical protein [Motilibacter deserti]|uniref:Flagellar biosynthesis protein FlhF n=1 Tax=Motilibacter deserti TaxID=2714956 RepID=A0ABX0GYD7_9ACTN|nr:hypothetical protein [Motilibacter deserti]NHC15126.1 hypothetical protein [Motilibacter deserti]